VTPPYFTAVGEEFRIGHIHLARSSSLPDNVGALYRIGTDTLVVCDHIQTLLSCSWGCAIIVHESVHAMIDMYRATWTRLLTGEAAAYLAQTLYRLHCHDELREWTVSNSATNDGAIFNEAIRLIDTFGLENRYAAIPWHGTHALREAINRHPQYQDVDPADLHDADGIDSGWF
jgi:hypothetical protein